MKTLLLVLAALAATTLAPAQKVFPGLKAILTDAEWKRAGLDRLTPDEIGVIDAALIRQQAAAGAAASSVTTPSAPKRGWLERFGLPVSNDDWESLPPLTAKVVSWESPNRFSLDNGQIWEGVETIPYELVGKAVEIRARPRSEFVLFVEGRNTTVRIRRVR
ncbi:MAG: hypothetical protein HYV96_14310 [Opitutae bacterium]|nr:hypothetical protein [Opitutae bacterium]